jgi:hypothetical protein
MASKVDKAPMHEGGKKEQSAKKPQEEPELTPE